MCLNPRHVGQSFRQIDDIESQKSECLNPRHVGQSFRRDSSVNDFLNLVLIPDMWGNHSDWRYSRKSICCQSLNPRHVGQSFRLHFLDFSF